MADLYFLNATSDGDWFNPDNWFLDEAGTDPAARIPSTGDTAHIHAELSGMSGVGEADLVICGKSDLSVNWYAESLEFNCPVVIYGYGSNGPEIGEFSVYAPKLTIYDWISSSNIYTTTDIEAYGFEGFIGGCRNLVAYNSSGSFYVSERMELYDCAVWDAVANYIQIHGNTEIAFVWFGQIGQKVEIMPNFTGFISYIATDEIIFHAKLSTNGGYIPNHSGEIDTIDINDKSYKFIRYVDIPIPTITV